MTLPSKSTFTYGYKTKKRRASRAPMQQALRNLPEGELEAIGKTGRQKGNDIRLELSRPSGCRSAAFSTRKMHGLSSCRHSTYFVDNGKIDP